MLISGTINKIRMKNPNKIKYGEYKIRSDPKQKVA